MTDLPAPAIATYRTVARTLAPRGSGKRSRTRRTGSPPVCILQKPHDAAVRFDLHRVCDIGYGGAFYAIVPASHVSLDLRTSPVGQLRAAALAVMHAIRDCGEVRFPTEPEMSFLCSVILTDDTPPAAPRPGAPVVDSEWIVRIDSTAT